MLTVIGAVIGLLVGSAIGALVVYRVTTARASSSIGRAKALVEEARREAEAKSRELLVEAKDKALALRQDAEEEVRRQRAEVERRTDRLDQREQQLTETLESRLAEVEADRARLADQSEELARLTGQAGRAGEEANRRLEQIAAMTPAEAKASLLRRLEEEAKRDAMALVRQLETRAREEAEARARRIVTLAIQRVASEQTTESTVAVLELPSDDMKGRIIGREGRNIRAFESVTGVNIIIDDTPEAVLLSSFDPVRREVARLTLERLIADGRIHPSRIEEMHERAKADVEEEIRRAGEQAVLDVGITDMHQELIRVLGRLRYRTSYGQNVLKHLVETSHLVGIMCAELGLPRESIATAKRGALLHDIGKAVTHEVEGSHAMIGGELARRLGETPEVCHIIESHHGEVEQKTIEAVLAQTADHISGGRPGARRETLESYVKRLEKLEEIATSYPGVEKTFAMQAGREVRVMVRPDDLDDLGCQVLARDIAKRIEEELQYPGQIKVTVVRETRSTEFAR